MEVASTGNASHGGADGVPRVDHRDPEGINHCSTEDTEGGEVSRRDRGGREHAKDEEERRVEAKGRIERVGCNKPNPYGIGRPMLFAYQLQVIFEASQA